MNEEHHLSPLISYNAISPKSAACDAHEKIKKTVKRGLIRADFSGFRVHQILLNTSKHLQKNCEHLLSFFGLLFFISQLALA